MSKDRQKIPRCVSSLSESVWDSSLGDLISKLWAGHQLSISQSHSIIEVRVDERIARVIHQPNLQFPFLLGYVLSTSNFVLQNTSPLVTTISNIRK